MGGDGCGGLAVSDRGSSKHGLFLWLRVDGGSRAAAIARLERVRGDLCGMENGLMVFHRLGPGRRTGCRFGIGRRRDRKSTRLNSKSLMRISYAVFCLTKKQINNLPTNNQY